MKQNSPKPTSGAPSNAPNRTQTQQRGPAHHHQHQQQQQHQHQTPIHYQQIQPAAFPQQAQGCIVLPQHTYIPPVQLSSAECSAMVPPNSQQVTSSPAGFSTAVQPAPRQYVQTSQHQRLPQMPQVQIQPAHYQPPVVDFVPGGSGGSTTTGGFSGAHQPYKQQQQQQQQQHRQQQYQPMPSYPVAQPAQLSTFMEPSAHPEGSTSDAQYFFDANCTMPVVQPAPPATGCRNPRCTSCTPSKRH